eukprot:478386-Amorphochlora_amoeboformis.AAC.1
MIRAGGQLLFPDTVILRVNEEDQRDAYSRHPNPMAFSGEMTQINIHAENYVTSLSKLFLKY